MGIGRATPRTLSPRASACRSTHWTNSLVTFRSAAFSIVEIDVSGFRLLKCGKTLQIEPKALNVLVFLVQNRGRLVEKREILDAVWSDAFVTENVLTRIIGQLRKALGDDAKETRYIETVPTRGYRFIAA